MAGNIINFNRARKQANQIKKQTQTSENRTKFGRTKAEKLKDNFDKTKASKHLDEHKIDE